MLLVIASVIADAELASFVFDLKNPENRAANA